MPNNSAGYTDAAWNRFQESGIIATTVVRTITTTRKFILRYMSLPRPESKAVRVLNETPDPSTGLYTINLWIAHPWYIKPTFKNRWGLKALFSRLFGDGAVPSPNGFFRESGYDLRIIGPATQENRGQEDMEAILAGLKEANYASGCPFHA